MLRTTQTQGTIATLRLHLGRPRRDPRALSALYQERGYRV